MAGFIRRFGFFPPTSVITQIEGMVIVDLPPPSSIQGVNTGVVGVVGEFADMQYATQVDSLGIVTTKVDPVEVTSAQDMIDKVGGWDETLGDFGGDDGNGYVTIRNKRFSRLVCVPVNLASGEAVRYYRELPLCVSAINPSPIVPMQAATVAAGKEFSSGGGTDKVRCAQAASFAAALEIAKGTDGVQVAAPPGFVQVFTSASASFVTAGVKPGDALVFGVYGVTPGAGTYRIVTVDSATQLTVERLDATAFVFSGATTIPYRVHPAAAFDTGGNNAGAVAAGYTLPARPTRVAGSSSVDGFIAAGTQLAATVAAPAQTATSWDPLSGLRLVCHATLGLTYTAAVQAPNAVSAPALTAKYQTSIDSLLADASPARDVSILVTSRTNSTLRSYVKQHVITSSATGVGRVACIGPAINTVSETTVLGDSDPGVGANRDERVIYCWPGVQTSIPEAVGFSIKTATGTVTTDGLLDVRADAYMASILSNLPTEKNPGQATDPVPLCLASILAFQRGSLPAFSMTDYILFKQNGVAAIRFDRVAGKVFQSGVTTSLTSGKRNINRRRLADEIEDSIAQSLNPLTKQVLTNQLRDTIDMEVTAYLEGLKSATNPAAQRIADYQVDSKSGNTPALYAAGIHVVIVRVKMLATADTIVLQAEVGPNVTITQQ